MMKPSEIVRKQVKSIEFAFYKDQDVRDRSVVEITSHQAFDPTHSPLPNGLYDVRLGPSKEIEPPCPTCGLRATYCPGHFGHIELAVPVYHPLLIGELVTLLRIKCLACHRLKISPRVMNIYKAKFHLLYTNRIEQFYQLDDELKYIMRDHRGSSDAQDGKVVKETIAGARALDSFLQELMPEPETLRRRPNLNSMERQLHKELVQACLSDCKGAKACSYCHAISPKIRQDAYNKIFQAPLAKKSERVNRAQGNTIQSALVGENEGYDSEDSRIRRDDGMEEDSDEDEDDDDELPKTKDKFMHASEVKAQAKRTWQTDPFLLNSLFGPYLFEEDGYEMFFLQAVPVPPSRFRPPMHLNGMAVEHSQTQYLSKMLQLNETIRNFMVDKNEPRAYQAWIDLQTTVNCFMDSSKDPSATPANQVAPGIKQILERKEGLFRKNMMGKRVDYACRSVISPDPYIGTNEIGLPRYFATTLTYPTPVTDLNVKEMRQLVERGPHNYPGARWVELHGRRVDLGKMSDQKREAVAAQLLTHLKKGGKPAIVGRQLRDGDYVLMNRQPSLHKPSIMAHRVRVLHSPTQKTIRMHYANCNTYNADYDGDEMNGHFPQSDLARAEAIHIARTDLQYIVPTDGSPLRGLIQDHVVGGVKLTKRDTFLKKWEYQQLLFSCLATLPGIEIIRSDARIELLPPTILKPEPLWTGKQLISTILLHLKKGSDRDGSTFKELPGLSTERKAKTPAAAFSPANEEHLVLIRDGELLRGVLDKAAFGATDFSLVHAVYEAYGPEKAGLLLNCFGRLFTAYIQYYSGHSCRVEDLVLTPESEKERRKLVERAYNIGSRAAKAWADSEGGKVAIPDVSKQENCETALKPVEAASAASSIGKLLSGSEGKDNFAALDGYMQGQLNPLSSAIVKKCLPDGLAVPFPYNTFGVMTMTGAKGSIVNQSQVTCALGQQALEGRRVPRMNSGRTLPSFTPYDPNPRADGFVLDRFLTGIRPQEYYFHCMAGREGLVDTAVKTSRSGYLQRCLMKHMEELRIHYDFTVRNAEGGVVQFLYGEDGLDPTKAPFLDCKASSFEFMARNHQALRSHITPLPDSSLDEVTMDLEMLDKDDSNDLKPGDKVHARRCIEGNQWKRGNIFEGWYEAVITKVHDDSSYDIRYLGDGHVAHKVSAEVDLGPKDDQQLECTSATIVKRLSPDPIISSSRKDHRFGVNGTCVSERIAKAAAEELKGNKNLKLILSSYGLSPKQYGALVASKYTSSICDPGEAVGCIAAQSVGEPSTQMTLNTFHLAGAGANVTLGIPRLREIIMTASRELKTPTMSVPLLSFVEEKDANRLARDFSKLTLLELISNERGIQVTERLEQYGSDWYRAYYISIKLYNVERIKAAFGLTTAQIASVIGKSFVPELSKRMDKELKRSSLEKNNLEVLGGDSTDVIDDPAEDSREGIADIDELNDDDNEGDDGEAGTEEDGADFVRNRRRRESVSYESDDEPSNMNIESEVSEVNESRESQDERRVSINETEELFRRSKDTKPTIERSTNTIKLQPLRVDPAASPLLMIGLVEAAASSTIVKAKKSILQGFINEEEKRGRCLQTSGVNFPEIWKLELVDHARLLSNDIWAICCSYGVEAARCSIVDQIRGVFGVYGIEVDPRHLALIADYMTFEGGFKAMNRVGMERTSSTLLQMSFETTVHFLRQAASGKHIDIMDSPSANLVVGRPVRHGTGAFELMAK